MTQNMRTLSTSKLVLGTVQIGIPYGINNQSGKAIPFEEAMQIFKQAKKSGIDTLDTAEAYGNAHEVIGQYHEKFPSSRFNVITKIPSGVHSKDFSKKIKGYLKDLGLEFIDTLMFHSFDTFKREPGILKELHLLKKDGVIQNIGVSIYTNEQLLELIDNESIDTIQLPFNLFDNFSVRGRLLEKAKKRGKTIHTRSAFLQGVFFMTSSSAHPVAVKLQPYLERINFIAEQEEMTVTELALTYCLGQEFIDRVLIGVDSVDHLLANVSASSRIIRNKAIEQINEIAIPDQNLINPSKWV